VPHGDDGTVLSMGVIEALLHPTYQRTCSCGYSWAVPGYYTKMRPRGLPWSFGGSTAGGKVTGSASAGRLDSVRAVNAQMADIVGSYKTCAECGSRRYTQKRLWR